MPHTLILYPATASIPLSLIAQVDPAALQMHPAASSFQIDASAVDPEEVRGTLMDAVAGQFVTIPIVYTDRLEAVQLQVQPQLWGAWSIIYTDDPDM